MFLSLLEDDQLLQEVQQIKVHLYGSLALTGIGHGTDIAVLMGLSGEDYTLIDTDTIPARVSAIKQHNQLLLQGRFQFLSLTPMISSSR